LFTDLLSSRINDLLKLSERYRISRLFWPILSTIRQSDFHTIVLTLPTQHTTLHHSSLSHILGPMMSQHQQSKPDPS